MRPNKSLQLVSLYDLTILLLYLKHLNFLLKVLQLFENVAIRHMKYSNDYNKKLDTELHKISFIKSILNYVIENIKYLKSI